MSSTTAAVVPAEKAEHIDNIFEGLVAIGCQLAMSSDGIVLDQVSRRTEPRRMSSASRRGSKWRRAG